jgi:hypothetical protein
LQKAASLPYARALFDLCADFFTSNDKDVALRSLYEKITGQNHWVTERHVKAHQFGVRGLASRSGFTRIKTIQLRDAAMKPLFAVLPLALTAAIASAEIVEIPPEEMTQEYIRDTTVIVKESVPVLEQAPKAMIKVSPLEDDFSEGESTLETTGELTAAQRALLESIFSDNSAQQNFQLDSQSSFAYQSPAYDPYLHVNDDKLREVLGLEPGAPIDYNNLQFPATAQTNGVNALSSDNPGQFQLVIPNSGNYSPSAFSTPNGEIGVTVTSDNIIFQMNTPQQ